jgi:hypothetical protein
MRSDDFTYCYQVPQPIDDIANVLDSLASVEIQATRKAKREAEKRAKLEEAKRLREEEGKRREQENKLREEDKKREEAKRHQEQEAKAKRERMTIEKEILARYYDFWKSGYENKLTAQKTLTVFPFLPVNICKCHKISCLLSKNEKDSLKACHHDVEKLLRASGNYSTEWLRKERLQWHPDRFGRSCDPDHRDILIRQTTELYAIFGILIDAENNADNKSQ